MRVVSRFEANLLGYLHFFLRRGPALPLTGVSGGPPPCLSRAAVELLQDALAKGVVLALARAGGWRRERAMRGNGVAAGRLWERTAPDEMGLTFSAETLRFLLCMTAVEPGKPKAFAWRPRLAGLTVGDQTLLYLAYAALRETQHHRTMDLARRPAFFRHALCRLAFPEDFAGGDDEPPDFGAWTSGVGACVLEALQSELAARWLQVERGKADRSDFAAMRALGRSQELALGAYHAAAESAGRLDLARFLLTTAAALLPEGAAARDWVGSLQPPAGARLADRTDAYRAATAFLRSLDRMAAWTAAARQVGYFDEGYAASQLWLADWERHGGDARVARAREIIRELDPLRHDEGQS
jgi:hypothetical protein